MPSTIGLLIVFLPHNPVRFGWENGIVSREVVYEAATALLR